MLCVGYNCNDVASFLNGFPHANVAPPADPTGIKRRRRMEAGGGGWRRVEAGGGGRWRKEKVQLDEIADLIDLPPASK